MPVRQVVRATMVASLLVPVTGCIHQHRSAGSPEGVADELPEPAQLADQDPDPATDPGGPQFCNPAGKQGDELKQCLAANDSVSRAFAQEAKQREPWFNFTPDSWVTSTEVDARYVLPVVKRAEAVQKLEATPMVELSKAEVGYFTGKPAAYPGLHAYLVRALMDQQGQGDFAVFAKDQAIFVRHDSPGLTEAPGAAEMRTALVVFLGFTPREVYVDCQAGE